MSANEIAQAGAARARLAAGVVGYALALDAEIILAPDRGSPPVAFARQVVVYLLATAFGMSLQRVGRALARDPTTIAYGLRIMEHRREDQRFDGWLARLEACLRAAPRPVLPGQAP